MATKAADVLVLEPDEIETGWRARVDYGDIDALADSIASDGQLQPIVVTEREGFPRYELIAGMRRYLACKKLRSKVAAVVVQVEDRAEAVWLQLVENVQRQGFSKLELGEGLKRHWEMYQEQHPESVRTTPGRRIGETKKEFMQRMKPLSTDEEPAERFTSIKSRELGLSEAHVGHCLQLAVEATDEEKATIHAIADQKERSKTERQTLGNIRARNKREKLRKRAEEAGDLLPKTGRLDHGDAMIVLDEYAKDKKLRFDLCMTDPSFNLDWSEISHTERSMLNIKIDWDKLDFGWIKKAVALLRKDAAVVAFCSGEAIGLYKAAFIEAGLEYRGFIVWWKTNPAPQHRPGYIWACEHIVWATRGVAHFTEWENAGTEEAHNAIRGPACAGNERLNHPTQKPEWLIDRLLDRHAPHGADAKGFNVLDPFAGVATTAVCCKRRGLWCASIEQKQEYVETAIDRLGAT